MFIIQQGKYLKISSLYCEINTNNMQCLHARKTGFSKISPQNLQLSSPISMLPKIQRKEMKFSFHKYIHFADFSKKFVNCSVFMQCEIILFIDIFMG